MSDATRAPSYRLLRLCNAINIASTTCDAQQGHGSTAAAITIAKGTMSRRCQPLPSGAFLCPCTARKWAGVRWAHFVRLFVICCCCAYASQRLESVLLAIAACEVTTHRSLPSTFKHSGSATDAQITAGWMDHAALAQANAALNTVHEIATLLDTGLDKEEVAILIALVENGVNPEVWSCHMACQA